MDRSFVTDSHKGYKCYTLRLHDAHNTRQSILHRSSPIRTMFKARAIMLAAWLLVLRQYASADTVNWSAITNSRGDRLPDFSFCGYHASDKPLPSTASLPSVIIAPLAGDQTPRIQAVLDETAASGGGIVELGPGTFNVSSGLSLPSNTTLRGSGIGSTQLSVIDLIKGVPLISLGNGTNKQVAPLATYNITDDYVGVGATTMTVQTTRGLRAGQAVFVSRAVTPEWVRYNGMADLIRDGQRQTWIQVCDHEIIQYLWVGGALITQTGRRARTAAPRNKGNRR